jgi:hypothetical protein
MVKTGTLGLLTSIVVVTSPQAFSKLQGIMLAAISPSKLRATSLPTASYPVAVMAMAVLSISIAAAQSISSMTDSPTSAE